MNIIIAALFLFSADGTTAGSSPRELPSQGLDRETGQVVVGLHALTDAQRARCGWYRIVPGTHPEAQSNEYWKVSGYAFDAGGLATEQYTRGWKRVKVRTWTPLAIKRACGDKWATVKSALQGADIYEDFMIAQELREDDAAFRRGYEWACATYGTNTVDEILAAAAGGKGK